MQRRGYRESARLVRDGRRKGGEGEGGGRVDGRARKGLSSVLRREHGESESWKMNSSSSPVSSLHPVVVTDSKEGWREEKKSEGKGRRSLKAELLVLVPFSPSAATPSHGQLSRRSRHRHAEGGWVPELQMRQEHASRYQREFNPSLPNPFLFRLD